MKSILQINDIEKQTGLKLSDIKIIKNSALLNSTIESVILFGSRAKGTYKHGSDIDLCLTGSNLSSNDVTTISRILNEETNLPYYFDVLNWNKIKNENISSHIQRCGIVL